MEEKIREQQEELIVKKETMTLLCLFRVLFCVGCGKADPSNAAIDYGASSVYSK